MPNKNIIVMKSDAIDEMITMKKSFNGWSRGIAVAHMSSQFVDHGFIG